MRKSRATFSVLLAASLVSIAAYAADNVQGNSGSPPLIFVAPVSGSSQGEVYSLTKGLIEGLRGKGLSAYAVSNKDDKLPGTGPAILISPVSSEEYCLEALVRASRLSTGVDQVFEWRQFRSEGASKLSASQCVEKFVSSLQIELQKRKLLR